VEPELERAVREQAGGPGAAAKVRTGDPRVGHAAPRSLPRVRVRARGLVVAPRASAAPHLELVHHELVVGVTVAASGTGGEVLTQRGEELRRDLDRVRVGPGGGDAQRRRVEHQVLQVVGVVLLTAHHAALTLLVMKRTHGERR
jgi:hypothetical protein